MKIIFLTSILVVSISTSSAQFGDLKLETNRTQYTLENESTNGRIAHENIVVATKMSDLFSYYPGMWIEKVDWVQLEFIDKKESKKQKGTSTNFTSDQLNLIKSCKVGDVLNFKAGYVAENAVTRKLENDEMDFKLKVIPYNEAKFRNGGFEFQKYVREQFEKNGLDFKLSNLKTMFLKFTVNEDGKITNTTLLRSCGNADVDKKAIETFNAMQSWQPATSKDGKKLSQNFVFSLGKFEGGC